MRTFADGRFCISGFPTRALALLAARKPGLASPPTTSASESWFAGGVRARRDSPIFKSLWTRPGALKGARLRAGVIRVSDGLQGCRKPVIEPGEPGQPVPKARVALTPVSETWSETTKVVVTDADGFFRFPDVAAGQFRLLL